MTGRLSSFGAAALIASTLILTTACATASDDDPAGDAPPTPVATSPTPTPSVTEAPVSTADPTCETIIGPEIVADFESVGWTSRAEPFRIIGTEVQDGIQCIWGDFSVATDHVQVFGWAPMTADAATDAQSQLVASGWRREDTPDGVIITESPETAITTDDNGYGLTYLFGDGWVKYADTRQSLILVVWPPAA